MNLRKPNHHSCNNNNSSNSKKINKSKGNNKRRIKINTTVILFVAFGVVAILVFLSVSVITITVPQQQQQINNDYSLWKATRQADLQLEARQQQHRSSSSSSSKMTSNKDKTNKEPRYYMVFSTSCSPFQDWQALAFFHFAKKVNQPGNVTRLVSGCKDHQVEALKKVHETIIAPLSPNFHLHFTPDFGVKDNQKYWNKPKSLLDYMETVMGFPTNAAAYNDDIIIILDPDMMLLRPITHVFDNYSKPDWVVPKNKTNKVVHGIPIAQAYGFGSGWLTSLKGNLSHVVGPHSPALNVSLKDANNYYPAGPPYLGTGKNMYDIATHWVKFLPRVHTIFPKFMAEMHAYSIAAAHLQLPHQLAKGFMLSDVTAHHQEAFGFLDNVTRQDACGGANINIPVDKLPLVMHYCQRYALGRWFFSKYKLREDFFDCDTPLLREPPTNVGTIYDWYIFPNGVEMKDYHKPDQHHNIVKNGWMLCVVLFSLNEVAIQIKTKHCDAAANFQKTLHFHDERMFEQSVNDPSNPFLIKDEVERNKKLFLGI